MCVLSDYEPTTMLCMPVKVQIGSESRVIAVAVACNKKNEKKLESSVMQRSNNKAALQVHQ